MNNRIYILTTRQIADGVVDNSAEKESTEKFSVLAVNNFETMDYEQLLDAPTTGAPPSYQMVEDLNRLDGDVLCFIHGFANTFTQNLEHIEELKEMYIDTGMFAHIVFFSWNSTGSKLKYRKDKRNAQKSGQAMARMFGYMHDYLEEMEHCGNEYHLMAHSMGNQVLEHMLMGIEEPKPFFKTATMLHADVDWDVFSNPKKAHFLKLPEIALSSYIITDESDEVLSVISRFTKNGGVQRLGFKVHGELPYRVEEMDVTGVGSGDTFRESTLDHWGYLENKTVKRRIRTEIFKK